LQPVRAFIGLGSNVGDSRRTLTEAVAALAALPRARLRGVSGLYRTTPVGVTDQPDFLNAVAALDLPGGVDPPADATALLVALKDIERSFGRRERRRWGPREVDLDLLLFGWHRISVDRPPGTAKGGAPTPNLLEVPHPSMRERLFVLAPLADLAPDLVPPGWPETVEAARRRRAVAEGPSAVTPIADWQPDEGTWIGPSGEPIRVEQVGPEDADEAARVHSASADEAYRDVAPRDPGRLARRLALWRRIVLDPGAQAFAARDRGRIVGILIVGPDLDGGPVGQVRAIYVREPWWGTGAGQALLDRAHAELATDHDEAILTVLTSNGRARRFYERNGWRLGEVLVEEHLGGHLVEVARYHRRLRGRGRRPA
jgi:2-amino-4-hydroxy-6-hydroxymethyldihydropteridine diphosphokinase